MVRATWNKKASERGFHKVQVTCKLKSRAGNRKIKATCIVKKSTEGFCKVMKIFGSVKRF